MPNTMNTSTKASIYVETAEILAHNVLPAEQFHLCLHAPECAQSVKPGHFIHLQCSDDYSLRRPLSVLRATPSDGTIEVLYKIVGKGTRQLSLKQAGQTIACMGPIGNHFEIQTDQAIPVLIGGGVGIPPILFFAEQLLQTHSIRPYVFIGSEIPYPFPTRPSRILIDGMPEAAIASMTLLDDLGIPCRLSSNQNRAGSYQGYVHELVNQWLQSKSTDFIQHIQLFACGPEPMLAAIATLAGQHNLPCQLSLEEYMACAVGGCAGCAVKTTVNDEIKMQRVCVDGPIFDAQSIYPDLYSSQS